MDVQKLVVDTNTFINNTLELGGLSQLHPLLTTPSALAEVKDSATKQRVQTYLPGLALSEPSSAGRTFVVEFAKKTGDFISLSKTDIDLIALAYDLVAASGQVELLRKTPFKAVNKTGDSREEAIKRDEGMGWGEAGWASDDESGWVGPSNISQLKTETKPSAQLSQPTLNSIVTSTAVLTSDFAMQNLLLQIGIPLLSLDGKIISKVKSFVLECFSCWAVSRKTDLVFCKKCGKDTLLKVTCEFLDNGEMILYRKRNKQIRTNGARFNLPEPKGGRQVGGVLLYEDDFLKPKIQSYLKRLEKEQGKEERLVAENYEFGTGLDGVKSQRQRLKALKVGHGGRNPNSKPGQSSKRR